MTIRQRSDGLGSHDVQNHVRYVEVYTIDDPEVEEQPVQVKLLRWDGDSYEVYGDAFRVGGVDLASEVAVEERFWVVWRRDSQRWERLTAGTGQAFQIIRGVTTAAVLITDVAFQIEAVEAYEQNALAPSEPTWIKAPSGGVVLAEGDSVWAIYRFNVLTFDPGGGDVQVDWLMFEPGSSNTPPLREFELTAQKTLAQSSATVKWLDLDGNLVGSDTTVYDPDQRFSGRPDAYVSGERGFRGQALLRTDLAAEDPDRWEVINLESFAEWAVLEKYSATIWVLSSAGFGGGSWDFRRPNVDGGQILVIDPGNILPGTVANGTKAIARLADPDTSPPTYAIYSLRGGGGGSTFVVRGTVYQTSEPADATYELVVTDLMESTESPGASITVQKHLGADGMANRRAYAAGTVVLAMWNATQSRWEDVTPAEGAVVTCVLRESFEAAVWNAVAKTLTPKSFNALWLSRPYGAPPQALAVVGSIQGENRSLDSYTHETTANGILINLVYSEGVFFIPFPVDCPDFVY